MYGSANSRKSLRAERARPRIEELHRLRARPHLRLEELAHAAASRVEQRVRPLGLLRQQPLGELNDLRARPSTM